MPDKKTVLLSFVLLSAFIMQAVPAVFAAPAGKMVIKPIITTSMSYESNYFQSQDNERAVTVYRVQPGLELGYTTAKSSVMLFYTLNANWYDENGSPPPGDRRDIDSYDYIGHDLDLSADTQLTEQLKIGLKDTFVLTRDPDRLDPYSNETIKQKYAKNSLNPNLLYRFGEKFTLGAGYTFTTIDYSNNADEDSEENKSLLNLHYNLNALNSLDLQYQYWEKDYDRTTPDYTSHQTMLFFNRALKYYTIRFGAGYQKREFDNSAQKDLDGVVWSVSVTADRPQAILSISQNYNDTAFKNDYYLATRFTAEVGHLFLEKINVKLKGYYQYSDYQENPLGRTDDTWAVSCRVNYIRNEMLTAGIETGYETRDSSISGEDYDNIYILLGITLNHDLGSR